MVILSLQFSFWMLKSYHCHTATVTVVGAALVVATAVIIGILIWMKHNKKGVFTPHQELLNTAKEMVNTDLYAIVNTHRTLKVFSGCIWSCLQQYGTMVLCCCNFKYKATQYITTKWLAAWLLYFSQVHFQQFTDHACNYYWGNSTSVPPEVVSAKVSYHYDREQWSFSTYS